LISSCTEASKLVPQVFGLSKQFESKKSHMDTAAIECQPRHRRAEGV
jgi:hypothetical protein